MGHFLRYLTSLMFSLSLLLFSGCGAPHIEPVEPQTYEPEQVISARLDSHVRIAVQLPSKLTGTYRTVGHGSGMIIGVHEGRLLVSTAEHVTDLEGSRLRIQFTKNDLGLETRVEAVSEDVDAAIVSCPVPLHRNWSWAHVTAERPVRGEEVYAIGSPSDTFALSIRGMVGGTCGETTECELSCPNGIGCFVIDRPLHPGFSGGAVLNNRAQVIGVVTEVGLFRMGFTQPDPAIAVFVGGEHLVPMLEEITSR